MSVDAADQVLEILARIRAGKSAVAGGDLERLLGRRPITLAQFARDHAAELLKQL